MRGRYILWVRHCESCSNVAFDGIPDIMSKLRQPLCTKKGIHQAHTFGEQLQKYSYKIIEDNNLEGVSFYSSYLPRAVETAKVISAGYVKRKTQRKINRVPFISEKVHFYNKKSGSQSMTSIYKSNCHVNALNSIIPIGLTINTEHLFKDIIFDFICTKSEQKYGSIDNCIDNCIIKGTLCDYNNFKKHILYKLPPNRLSIIVSHGGFIRKEVLSEFKGHTNELYNLEAHLIHYSKNGDDIKAKYIKNLYITKCNTAVKKIKKGDISHLNLDEDYKKYFNCKYHYHNKNPILRTKRKSSIEKYC